MPPLAVAVGTDAPLKVLASLARGSVGADAPLKVSGPLARGSLVFMPPLAIDGLVCAFRAATCLLDLVCAPGSAVSGPSTSYTPLLAVFACFGTGLVKLPGLAAIFFLYCSESLSINFR